MRSLHGLWLWFQTLRTVYRLPKMTKSYGKVRDHVGIRARPESCLDRLRSLEPLGADQRKSIDAILFREEAPGLYSTLVFDFGGVQATIDPSLLRDWGLSFEEVYTQGLRNIRKMGDIEVGEFEGPKGTKLRMMCVAEFECVAVLAFHLADFPAMLGINGAIVGFPSSDTVLALPLGESPPSPKAVADIADVVREIHKTNPDPLTPQLFSFKDGAFIRYAPSLRP